jgi:hypothetical protein
MRLRTLAFATLAHCGATLLHFTHNGVFLDDYPNLPSSITVMAICWTWLGITSIGGIGWLLLRFGRVAAGLVFIGGYACFGFDGLAHYGVASVSSHTIWMNATIWFEAVTAMILLSVVARTLLDRGRMFTPSNTDRLR